MSNCAMCGRSIGDGMVYGAKHSDKAFCSESCASFFDDKYEAYQRSQLAFEEFKKHDRISRQALLEKFDSYGCPKERATYLFKALRSLVEEQEEVQ